MTNRLPTTFNNVYIPDISFILAFGGYLFGFDFAIISGALPFPRPEFELNAWWEVFLTGSLALNCIVGYLFAGKLADRFFSIALECLFYFSVYFSHSGRKTRDLLPILLLCRNLFSRISFCKKESL